MEIRTAVLTVSDRSARGEREDISGPRLIELVKGQGWQVLAYEVIPDDLSAIREKLAAWADSDAYDLILTTGGTGFASRDVTPEATLAVIERAAPGLAEGMRAVSLQSTPYAMLSRAAAGIRRRSLILNLPGSPRAAAENFHAVAAVLPHAVELLQDAPSAEAGHQI